MDVGMIIEEEDFRLTPIALGSTLYNLELIKIVNKGKANERKEFQMEAYGIDIKAAINKLIHYRTNTKNNNKKVSLLNGVKELNEAKNILFSINNKLKDLYDEKESRD